MDILPSRIMSDILWAFHGQTFKTQKEFEEAVRDYHVRIVKSDERWRPSEIALERGKVSVQYHCWRKDEDVEPTVSLESDNGTSFTHGELLFKIHNAVVDDLKFMDHSFFEGLSLHKQPARGAAPLYFLSLGS
jgi:hypothetical protein